MVLVVLSKQRVNAKDAKWGASGFLAVHSFFMAAQSRIG